MMNQPGTVGSPRPTPPLPTVTDPAAAAMAFLSLMGDAEGAKAARAHLVDVQAAHAFNAALLDQIAAATAELRTQESASLTAQEGARQATVEYDRSAAELRQLQSDEHARLQDRERRLDARERGLDQRASDLEKREAAVRRARAALAEGA